LLDTVSLHYGGRRVLICAHQVVVLCLRYVIEGLGEEEVLAIDRPATSATAASPNTGSIRLAARTAAWCSPPTTSAAPMEEDDTPVTAAPDAMVAARG
jgi:broad specificity phosphatase PhoE